MDFPAPFHPQGSDPLNINIPYVGSCDLVEGPFVTLPLRHGFTIHEVDHRSQLELDQKHSYAEYTALLQTWLFFGFIHAVGAELELPIELSEFVQYPIQEGRAVVTAKPLTAWNAPVRYTKPDLVERIFKLQSSRTLVRRRHSDRLALFNIIEIAFHNATVFDFINPQDSGESEDRALTILSIKFLVHYVNSCIDANDNSLKLINGMPTLAAFRPYACHMPVKRTRLMVPDTTEIIAPSAKILKSYLQDRGWCPVYADDLLARNIPQSVYSVAAIVPQIGTPFMHEECSVQKGCLAWNVKLDEIRLKHTKPSCCCTIVIPDMSLVYELLEQGKIPIIEVALDPRSKFLLKVKSADTNIGYTAISHIWADGLACGHENGLLECQLRRIRDLILNLEAEFITRRLAWWSGSSVFYRASAWQKRLRHRVKNRNVSVWMDALCIPVHDSHQPDKTAILKKQAISLMTPTYAGAKNVLVLDHYLEQIGSDVDHRAMSSLITHSRWMQRCWTLQEGALAQRLFFQCCGWVYTTQDRWTGVDWNDIEAGTFEDVDDAYLTQLIESLLSRSTSMPSDIDAIFANLSHLDVNEFIDYPKEHRAKAFFRSQMGRRGAGIPLNLLLRRLSDVPQRARSEWWVPDLNSRASFFCDGRSRPRATLCDQGLIIGNIELEGRRVPWWADNRESRRLPEGSVRSQKFRLNYTESVSFWVELDLTPEQISTPELSVAHSARTLIFPDKAHLLLPRNPRGFVDRGICITHTDGLKKMPLTIQGVKVECEVWPVQYDCAFSFGVFTSSSSIEFADCPTIRPLDVSGETLENATYLIQTDITDWPDVQSVRISRRELMTGQYYHFYIRFALVLLMAVLLGLSFIYLLRRSLTIFFNLELTVASLLLILFGYPSLLMHIRRRRFRQWARSFALKDREV